MNLIIAVDKNWGIGYDNKLLCNIKDDLKNFKKITTGHKLIMGRKTFDSIFRKGKSFLPNRHSYVFSSKPSEIYFDTGDEMYDNVTFINPNNRGSLHRLFSEELENNPSDYFLIGGATIIYELIPIVKTIYLTEIDHMFELCDTHIPNLFSLGFEYTEDSINKEFITDEKTGLRWRSVILKRI